MFDVQGFVAAPQGVQASGNTFTAGISVAWSQSPYDGLIPSLQYSRTGQNNWQFVPVSDSALSAHISGLVDGVIYDIRIAWATFASVLGPYTVLTGVAASASTTIPTVPTDFKVTDSSGGDAFVQVTASTSADNWKTNIYRDGTLILSQVSPPESLIEFIDPVGAGSYEYTVESENVSEVKSPTVNTTTQITVIS